MLICSNGHIFEDFECGVKFDRVGERYSDGYDYCVCPHCGDDNLNEAVRCECCDEYVDALDLDEGWCPECQDKLVNDVIKTLKKNFTSEDLYLFRLWVPNETFEELWEG